MAAPTAGERGSALEKALDVLDRIVRAERAVGLAELAEQTDLPRPTIHRVLQQLVEQGLILRATQKDRYVVGPAMQQLAVNALANKAVQTPLRSILEELVQETQETSNIGVMDQDKVVYIERVEGISPLRLQLQVGSKVPFHCTAIGKLIAAEQDKAFRMKLLKAAPIIKHTDRTIGTVDGLETEFARIREQGYSFNNEEYVEGLTAVAVPIRDGDGRTVAALSVHALQIRMPKEKALTYLDTMNAMAERVARAWSLRDD
ncbi:MAG: IclR family transcriptional regulator [Pseudomonadota bacterium]